MYYSALGEHWLAVAYVRHLNRSSNRHRHFVSDTICGNNCSLMRRTSKELKRKKRIDDDIPDFNFDFQLVTRTKLTSSLEEYLNLVDELKEQNHWTDGETIWKVVQKMKSLPDVATWFSSVKNVLTWKQWKSKLVSAFPDNDDYEKRLSLAASRRKRKKETFMEYYTDKIQLLLRANIRGRDAISCILAGIHYTDVLIGCIGRMLNYEAPDQLREYFQKCDENRLRIVPVTSDKAVWEQAIKPARRALVDRRPVILSAGGTFNSCNGMSSFPSSRITDSSTITADLPGRTIDCPSRNIEPPDREQLEPSSSNSFDIGSLPKKIKYSLMKNRCYKCLKEGHVAVECMESESVLSKDTYMTVLAQVQAQGGSASSSDTVRCYVCGEPDHISYNCPHSTTIKKKKEKKKRKKIDFTKLDPEKTCAYCHKSDHLLSDCLSLKKKMEKMRQKKLEGALIKGGSS
ncbi:hypothetical protein NQ318_011805 [Aromia moschata]|uniref:CCHC-type domain-containing protein n=1 Tax=Aromia moschata TaxID=1265417 RepID=A0AAV8Y6G4_9CUCU|nr:hypothetical protein NQ318_011805 [Aromia moschata]